MKVSQVPKFTEPEAPEEFQNYTPLDQIQKSSVKKDFIINFFAGCTAGVANVVSGHPFDTIKVRMQMIETTFGNCFRDIIKSEGAVSLYKGVASPLMSIPFVKATSFLTFEAALRKMGIEQGQPITPFQSALAGSTAGVTTSFIYTPVEYIKCNLQMSGVGVKGRPQGALEYAF